MKTSELQTATFTDIVFDGRNKEYGAYELRTHYSQRLWKSLAYTMILTVLIFTSFFLFGKKTAKNGDNFKNDTVILRGVVIPPDVKKPTTPPPPPKSTTPPPPKVEMAQFSTPRMVEEPKNPMKSQNQIDQKENIGEKDEEGEKKKEELKPEETSSGSGGNLIADSDNDGINNSDDACPTVNAQTGKYTGIIGKGCPEKPKEEVITKPDEVATFRGDWASFLSNTIEYPDTEDEGVVIVKYIVDLNGNISDVKAVSGSVELRKEAERAVRSSSGRWAPAKLGGKPVKAYGSQRVVFKRE